RRETGDGRRETGDGRRETGDGRRETGDGRRETEFSVTHDAVRITSLFSILNSQFSILLACLLALIAIAPYAYLLPLEPDGSSRWSSYIGPYPSSLNNTFIAWRTRPSHERELQLAAALRAGDAATARSMLEQPGLPPYVLAVGRPLLLGLEGRPADGLSLLEMQNIAPLTTWQTAMVRAELLRQAGDLGAARAIFTQELIDNENPVGWAWDWLHPPPLPNQRIDIGGNLDLGYIQGFYLGEGDPAANGNFRWSGPEARLRFPAAGSGQAQQFCMRADGRGWPADLPMPRVSLLLADTPVGAFSLQREVSEYCLPLPASAPGSDVVVTMQTRTFVPSAADLLGQQGSQASQLRRLGLRLDWAELRDTVTR
ncbi:MAG: hypothetical protein MUD01_27410, partial [Chloroflexaceae bacterium]|nr:hypothetical protein [Chloroflexaceae bacterium]